MNVLLDEDLPHDLRVHLGDHSVSTVAYLGWSGLKNGALLKVAIGAGIQVFVTGDKNLRHQQNLAKLPFGLVLLSTPNWPVLKLNLEQIRKAIDSAQPGLLQFVECVKPSE